MPRARQVRMPSSTAFPSGHSAAAFAFATGVGQVLPAAGVPLRVLAALVAYSRVHTGVHYPGDVLVGQGRQRNDYLSRVARQIAQYRVYPANALANNQGGRVVMRVTVARSGQVLDVGIRTSSGWPAIDAAEVETIRKAGSFPPLPSEMPGDPVVLVLPITYNPAGSRGR